MANGRRLRPQTFTEAARQPGVQKEGRLKRAAKTAGLALGSVAVPGFGAALAAKKKGEAAKKEKGGLASDILAASQARARRKALGGEPFD